MSTQTSRPAAFALLCLAATLPLLTQAQTPPDAGQILNEQNRAQQPRLQRLPSEDLPMERPALRDDTGERITVREIVFSGEPRVATQDELSRVVTRAIGQSMGFHELQDLADQVTAFLRARGYPLAGAYLPAQDVTDGRIEIAIAEGRIQSGANGVVVRPGAALRMHPSRLRAIAEGAVQPGSAVRERDLERAVLLINDLPGISARAALERGDEPGASRLALAVSEGRLLDAGGALDTFGNRYNGTERIHARLGVNDPLRIGDQIGLGFMTSEGMDSFTGEYSLPLGSGGLRVGGAYTSLQYEIGKELRQLEAEGRARTATLHATYPFLRSRLTNLRGTATYNHRSLADEMVGVTLRDKRVNSGTVSLAGSHQDRTGGGGITQASLAFTSGELDLSRVAADLQVDALTARTDGSFAKLAYGLARLQRATDRIALFAAIQGQKADGNLDSSERFLLGGPSGVRAYPVGEGSGDSGWVGTVEIRYDAPLSSRFGELQLIGFADHGEIRMYEKPWNGAVYNLEGRNRYALSGAGVGVNLTAPGRYSLRFSYAAAIGDNPGRSATGKNADGRSADAQVWLQAALQL